LPWLELNDVNALAGVKKFGGNCGAAMVNFYLYANKHKGCPVVGVGASVTQL
jgi:hypothetical protein